MDLQVTTLAESVALKNMASVIAAADIGSNTAHLLVAATDGQLVMRIDNMNEWIPLGEEVARTGKVSDERIDELSGALKEFRTASQSRGARSLYVFATEAMRSASNFEAVLKRIKSVSGVTVEVISPLREAELSLRGVRLDTRDLGATLMFEVGGGSAQVAVLDGERIVEEASLPLGTGRVIAESGLKAEPTEETVKRAEAYIAQTIDSCKLSVTDPIAVASGGVARGLWRALHPDGEKALSLREIEFMAWTTSRLTTPRIIERFDVKAKRAGTLLPGALIYSALLHRFNCHQIFVSEFGVREGAVLELAHGSLKGMAL
jgi:exopolyphosphatase/guanosine-5'-triphosphate,3'-diphosphate pyrophosphatase